MPLPCKMFFSLIVFNLSKSYCIELSSLDQMKLSLALMVYLEVFSVWTIHSRYNQFAKKNKTRVSEPELLAPVFFA